MQRCNGQTHRQAVVHYSRTCRVASALLFVLHSARDALK
jgi:hypothetical protein